MARHGDTRSPSPVGSTYSSSRRNRRDDDRYERSRRDDGRGYRRSRSPEVRVATRKTFSKQTSDHGCVIQRRYRERERPRDRDGYRRRDRSLDRRDEDSYRPGRRDRSRDRRRSRDRNEDVDRRQSRDRDYRARRDDSRERDRRRIDDSADLKPKSRRDASRDRATNRRSRSRTREVCHQETTYSRRVILMPFLAIQTIHTSSHRTDRRSEKSGETSQAGGMEAKAGCRARAQTTRARNGGPEEYPGPA